MDEENREGTMQLTEAARQTFTPASRARMAFPDLQMRFAAIWIALAALLVIGALLLPRSVQFSAISSILPFAAFLAIAAMGQALVIMARGIDLSVPAIVTLSSTLLLGVSGGSDGAIVAAIAVALLGAGAIGLVNGILVAVFRLNALIVTLAVGSIVSGVTLWYRQGLPAEATVPVGLAEFGSARWLGLNSSVWIALLLTVIFTFLLRKTVVGRRFEAVGANPQAAYASGLEIMRYQGGSFVAAALLYGIVGVLLSAFIRNPTLEVGAPYLLTPIAAAVLGATAISGGIGSMIAVLGGALFLTQLGQMLKLIGLPTSYQLVIQGCAIAIGMWLSTYLERRAIGRLGRRK
jgi:ribose transport system permease protein